MPEGLLLQNLFEIFHSARVLCLGDVMLDRFIYGRVDRVSAEAPVQILHVNSERGGVASLS